MRRPGEKMSSHIFLVFLMSVFQSLYDISLFFRLNEPSNAVFVGFNTIQLFSGLAASFSSNWISFTAFYIVLWQRVVDAAESPAIVLTTSIVPSFIVAAIYLYGAVGGEDNIKDADEELYYALRFLLIGLNFFFCASIIIKVNAGSKSEPSLQERAIRLLANRMIWYPIAQTIGRSGLAWYELQYGYDVNSDDPTNPQFSCLIFLAIITPFASVAYLIIFLVMQPDAYEHFMALLCCTSKAKTLEMIRERKTMRVSEAESVGPTSTLQHFPTCTGTSSMADPFLTAKSEDAELISAASQHVSRAQSVAWSPQAILARDGWMTYGRESDTRYSNTSGRPPHSVASFGGTGPRISAVDPVRRSEAEHSVMENPIRGSTASGFLADPEL